ncbi:isopenicillin N synthase family dioxygenase [Aquibium oceanicum]|uniref:2OG-Fe(II) oxygenase n=1 Tax=Aquibium oceanicum TaxID=1670800 RepID=A0A1L3SX36_9HYPH|nr:2-oxoglutarate and iron-dependent oxygenase domain-containing protein [Aquibium oceanicum]APH73987.1 2OG-Fe(II) oxygenase [Aquibium oceanicum]
MSGTIPLIDVSALAGGSPAAVRALADEIGRACRDIGFFYVTNHSVPADLIDRAFAASADFFAREEAEKMRAVYSASGNRGYVPMKGEALDPTRPADLKEAFNIGLELPPDDPEIVEGRMFRAENRWPEMAGFRDTMLAYFDACHGLGRAIHRAFAIDIGIDEDFFEDKLDRPMAVLRLLHYPPAPERLDEGQLGAGEHTDYGCVTLLATDGVGGLEVRNRAGEWLKAPHVPGAFVCNIGDCLMRWMNDIYVSTPHRVVSPSGRERFSIAFFLDPNPEAEIACLPNCASDDRPARYVPIRGDAFLLSRLSPTYETSGLGKGAKEASKTHA